MSIEQFVSRRMNPFTRKEFEGIDVARICLPESPGSYVRLEAGPVEKSLAQARGCRVGGPPVIREGKRFVAQLERPGDVVAEKDFEESSEAELVHRAGWSFWRWGGHWINAAITKELKAAGLDGSLESLRAAEANGVDVIALIKGANHWRHLWSVACDEDLGMDWGDGGRLEFMIRDEHLANADFAKAVVDVDPFS